MRGKADQLPKDKDFLVVGIGASAGGIQALQDFFRAVPADSGIAYVVILHLSPDFESQLSKILQVVSAIPVIEITEDQILVEPDKVYVIPPNKALTIIDGYLQLSARAGYEERRAPVDIFFRTLASARDGRAVAVVLSGTGSDGSMGLRRIKEFGGIVLVQEPGEAEYDDMPRNSIAQGLVDFVLPVEKIPGQIIQYRDQRNKTIILVKEDEVRKEEDQEQTLREIFTQLRLKTGHDFSTYKRATVLRRIERRMNVREISELSEYGELVRKEKDEAIFLLKDLLISVTNFFRDKVAFEALENIVFPRIFANKNSQDLIRIWVSACATGEEAYSIAMLCAEKLNGMPDRPTVQIFASDIDTNALNIAREGLYSNADVADVSPERLRKFFSADGAGFRVKRDLREMILFARHNTIKDPPFSKLDLATCRNLLIYLNRHAQDRLIDTFHFALKPGGFLFLGSSESIDGKVNQFSTIDREHCIFQSRAVVSRTILPGPDATLGGKSELNLSTASIAESKITERMSLASLHQQILELYAPPSIVVNSDYDIIHVSRNAGKHLRITGEPSYNILNVIRPELRIEVRGALYSAAQSGTMARVNNVKFGSGSSEEIIDIVIRPVVSEPDAARGFFLVLFEPSGKPDGREPIIDLHSSKEPITAQLEKELAGTRKEFRNLTEQFEVQTEEFKASNEELQAINEELRSAAEELETSKEELQSVNEELTTVNQELKIKIEELSQTNNNFKNLITATSIGTIFLDRSFSINLFTPAAATIFNLKPADLGRPLTDITNNLPDTDILYFLEKVIADLQPAETEVETRRGETFLMRVLPYRTSDDHINGLILTFIDISARKAAEELLRNSEEHMRAMFNQARAGVAQTNLEGVVVMVNRRFCEILGYEETDLLDSSLSNFIFQQDRERINNLVAKLLDNGKAFDTEVQSVSKDGRSKWLHDSATLIHTQSGKPVSVLHIIVDINNQKNADLQKDEFIGIASHELKTPVTSIKAYSDILTDITRTKGDAQLQKLVTRQGEQIDRLIKLINELLDTTRLSEGKLTLHKTHFDLPAAIRVITEMFQYGASNINLQLELEDMPPCYGDKDRIEQVIINLLDNAVKYAPDSDKIIVSCSISNNAIQVCVKDFGPGLSEEAMEKVFDRFFRAENHYHANSLGLGLFISMQIARLHGGTITVESPEKKGAKFCLVLPLNKQGHAT